MKHKKIAVGVLLGLIILIAVQCNPGEEKKEVKAGNGTITPVDLPAIVPGFSFPEDSNKIYSWLNDKKLPNGYDSVSVYKHAWGLWAGLTSRTKEVYAGDPLLVFETWQGITEIREIIKEINVNGFAKEPKLKRGRTLLDRPHQFEHGFVAKPADHKLKIKAFYNSKDTIDTNAANNPWVTVSYSPGAAAYAIQNKILDTSVLNSYKVTGAIGSIPQFPNTGITIKPVYIVGSKTDSLIQVPVWSGPPGTPIVYGSSLWPKCVYADVHNRQKPNKLVIPTAQNQTNPDSILAATCNVSDFINFKVDSVMAAHMNAADSTEDGSGFAKSGGIAILVAMHVATKEINNWTWQTFYWDPNPGMPYSPSSSLAAGLKPAELQGMAGHYSLSTSYVMVLPNQPINEPASVPAGLKEMLGYNPYLEAGLASFPNGGFPPGPPYYGVQTNCMSCHGRATPDFGLGYASDMYFGINNKMFVNTVQIDFAWSIAGNLIQDSVKYKPK